MQSPSRVPLQARSANIATRQTVSPLKASKRTWHAAKLDDPVKAEAAARPSVKHEMHPPVLTPRAQAAKSETRAAKRVKTETVAAAAVKAEAALAAEKEKEREKEAASSTTHAANVKRWAQAYLKQFPSHIFYFDQCSEEDVRKCTKRINMLDGHVEPFFSKKVNVVVTTRDFIKDSGKPSDDQENARIAKLADKLPANDVLAKARALGIRVWSLRKLRDSVLKHLLAETQDRPSRAAQTLSNTLRHEKTIGINSENVVPFVGPFILCRDMTETFRPIMCREWKPVEETRDGDWPQWRITRFGRCPFQRDENAEQTKYQGKVTQVRQELGRPVYNHINASGMVQITSAIQSNVGKLGMSNGFGPTGKENAGSNAVASLHKKAVTSKRLPKMVAAIEPPIEKKAKVEMKSGYCENCRDKFDSFEQHLKSIPHRQYANNAANFRELDALLAQLAREPLSTNGPL